MKDEFLNSGGFSVTYTPYWREIVGLLKEGPCKEVVIMKGASVGPTLSCCQIEKFTPTLS